MKHTLIQFFAGAILISCLLSGSAAQETKGKQDKKIAGKIIFLDKKCSGCHSIEAAGITKKTGSASKTGPPDLSTVGMKHNAAFLTKFLQRNETVNSKKHLIKFSGNDEDLDTLTTWLESLKSDSTKKGKK